MFIRGYWITRNQWISECNLEKKINKTIYLKYSIVWLWNADDRKVREKQTEGDEDVAVGENDRNEMMGNI